VETAMPRNYIVEQGDDLVGIAGRFGFADVAKVKAANPDLDRKPGVLHPGDKVTIPDLAVTKLDARKEYKNSFKLTSPRRKLKIPLKDGEGKPIANAKFTLGFSVENYMPREGTTDGNGVIEVEVSWRETELVLAVDNAVIKLRLGHLNPVDDTDDGGLSGVAQRLALLGYHPGPLAGSDDAMMQAAIEAFQHDSGLKETGEFDPDTVKKLDDRSTSA
jgi:hypothetical protein